MFSKRSLRFRDGRLRRPAFREALGMMRASRKHGVTDDGGGPMDPDAWAGRGRWKPGINVTLTTTAPKSGCLRNSKASSQHE